MAIVKLKPIEIVKHNEPSVEVDTANLTVALDGTAGAYYEHKERDDKYVIIAQNTGSSASNLTIKKGNGIQGVADNVITIAAGKTVAINLESGCYKNVSGDNKGRVIMTGAATIKVAVVKLP